MPEKHSIENEQWLPVVGYEGCYEVSNCGRVKSVIGGRYRNQPDKILRPRNASGGYHSVGLILHGVRATQSVHSLVMAAFVGPRPPNMETNHKDGNKANNRPSNLEYCTPSENMRHAYAAGLVCPRIFCGEKNGRARLTEDHVRDIKAMKGLRTHKKIASVFGVSEAAIRDILSGDTWKHVGAKN